MPQKTSVEPGKVLEFCIDETLKITCLTWKSPGKVLEFEIEKSVGTLSMLKSKPLAKIGQQNRPLNMALKVFLGTCV